MRKGLHIARNFYRPSLEFLHTAANIGRILLELSKFRRQHCKSLVDVIVKFPPDPPAFLLLRFNQLSTQVRESRFHPLEARNVFGENENPSGNPLRFSQGRTSQRTHAVPPSRSQRSSLARNVSPSRARR